jgi:hypothetical protein
MADNHVPIVMKSASLNLLEPSGAVQACNGIVVCCFINGTAATPFPPLRYILPAHAHTLL